MGDSADFARRRREVIRQFNRDRDREQREFEAQRRNKKEGFFSKLLHAPARAVDAVVHTPFERDRPSGGAAGAAKAAKVIRKVTEGGIKGYAASYDPREYARMTKGALRGNRLDQAALAMSVIPIVRPGKFLRAGDYNKGVIESIGNLDLAAKDLDEYGFLADEAKASQLGHDFDDYGDEITSEVGRAIRSLTHSQRTETQGVAKKFSERLLRAVDKSDLHQSNGPDPAQMSFDEFMVSPIAAWHSTPTAPGLGVRGAGIHAGTPEAAFDRYVMSRHFGGRYRNTTKFVPVAMRGRIADSIEGDPSFSFVSRMAAMGDMHNTWQGASARDMARLRSRKSRRYIFEDEGSADVQPYLNSVEDIGSVSFEAAHPAAVRTHLDTIRDHLAATGEIPRGLGSYRNAPQLLQRLRREINTAQEARTAFNSRKARKNVFLSAVRTR